jgi:hypothetical protein
MPSYLVIAPPFGLTKPEMLSFIGVEQLDGQAVNHLRTTRWWSPDIARMAMMDTSSLGMKPETSTLDLWTTINGAPVYATFSATNTATDGTKLVDIETTYTFTNVGVPQPIGDPMATPSPPPSAPAAS